jgi:hypothetical protein
MLRREVDGEDLDVDTVDVTQSRRHVVHHRGVDPESASLSTDRRPLPRRRADP